MGKIFLENMEFFAYHGHYEEERIVGNRFLVNIEIDTDTETAGLSDDLADAVNYQALGLIVQEQMKKKSQLMEHIAHRIVDAIYAAFPGKIDRIRIKISKLNPPLGVKTEKVSIIIEK